MQTTKHLSLLGSCRAQALYEVWWGEGAERNVLFMEVLTCNGTHCCCRLGSVGADVEIGHRLDQGIAFVRSLCSDEMAHC